MVFPALEQLIRAAFGPEAAAALASPQGLSLHGSIGMEAFLRSDGSVWVETYALEQLLNEGAPVEVTRREVFGIERLTNLVIAAERQPPLAALLPIRSDASHTCERCGGEGILTLTAELQRPGTYFLGGTPMRVYCPDCGGLGFV